MRDLIRCHSLTAVEKKGLGELEVCLDKSLSATWPLKSGAGGFVSLCNEQAGKVSMPGSPVQGCQGQEATTRESACMYLLSGHHERGHRE